MQDFPIFKPQKYRAFNSRIQFNRSPQHSTINTHYNSPPKFTSTMSDFPKAPYTTVERPQGSVTVKQRLKQSAIKGDSRIEYVPIEKKVIDYIDEPRYQIVPRKRIITDYIDQVKVDVVPRQVVTTDYYAVENIRCYIPQKIQEKKTEYVQKQKTNIKYEYVPVERQIVHYPQHSHEDEMPRYLGIAETKVKKYQNLRESDILQWQREFGYKRGQSIETLNRKIREKHQRDKSAFFNSVATTNNSNINQSHGLNSNLNVNVSQSRGYNSHVSQYQGGLTKSVLRNEQTQHYKPKY